MKKLRDSHGYFFTLGGACLLFLTAYLAGEPTWPHDHGTRVTAAATTAIVGVASLLGGWRVLSRDVTAKEAA